MIYCLDTFQILRIVRLPSVRISSNSEMEDGCVDPHCVLCTLEMKDGDAIVFGRQIPYHLANPSRQNKNNTLSPIQGRPASSRGQVLFMHNTRLSTPRWPGTGMPLSLRRTGPAIISINTTVATCEDVSSDGSGGRDVAMELFNLACSSPTYYMRHSVLDN